MFLQIHNKDTHTHTHTHTHSPLQKDTYMQQLKKYILIFFFNIENIH